MSKLRWQFRLHSLLLVVLLVAISAGWYGNRVRHNRLQKQLIASIAERGGYVWLDVVGPYIDIQFTPSPIDRACGQVRCVAGPSGKPGTFTDTDLALLEQLDNLRNIDFTNTNVSADAILNFRRLHPEYRIAASP